MSESNMIQIVHITLVDSRGHHGTVIEIHMSHMSAEQIRTILEILLTMMYNIRHSTLHYAIIICNTVNAINMVMDEMDNQTVFATLSPALQGPNGDAYAEELIRSLDDATTTAEMSVHIPEQEDHAHILDTFVTHTNNRHLFTVELQAASHLPWDTIVPVLIGPVENCRCRQCRPVEIH